MQYRVNMETIVVDLCSSIELCLFVQCKSLVVSNDELTCHVVDRLLSEFHIEVRTNFVYRIIILIFSRLFIHLFIFIFHLYLFIYYYLGERLFSFLSKCCVPRYEGTEVEFNYCWRGCQIPTSSLPKSELVDVRKNIRSPKPCFNIPRDRQLP